MHSRCAVRFNKIAPLPAGRIDNWLISLSLAVKACNLLVQHANLHCVSCETTVSLPGYFRKLQAVNVPINDPGKRNKCRMKGDSRIVKFWKITRRGVVEVTKETEETNWAREEDCKRRVWAIRTKEKKIGDFDKVEGRQILGNYVRFFGILVYFRPTYSWSSARTWQLLSYISWE